MNAAQFERRDPTAVADAVSLLDSLDGPTVLVGSTASARPEPAFDAGFDVLADARVADPDAVGERVLWGDCAPTCTTTASKGFAATDDLPGSTVPTGRPSGHRHRQTAPDHSQDTP